MTCVKQENISFTPHTLSQPHHTICILTYSAFEIFAYVICAQLLSQSVCSAQCYGATIMPDCNYFKTVHVCLVLTVQKRKLILLVCEENTLWMNFSLILEMLLIVPKWNKTAQYIFLSPNVTSFQSFFLWLHLNSRQKCFTTTVLVFLWSVYRACNW
jgi:hypothetical protein